MAVNQQIESIEEALKELGATPDILSEVEKEALDQQGYVLLPGIIEEQWLEELRETYEDLMAKEGDLAGIEVHQEAGTRRLSDLVNKGEAFDRVYTHPKVLAAVYHVLSREFKLSSLNGRDALPGYGQQGFHADWPGKFDGTYFSVVNSIWMLDDFTAENGATRVLPGSHRISGSAKDHLPDPLATHPSEVQLLAPAGSVGVFNSHLWHGGTTNQSNRTRRALHCFFTARENSQQLNQKEYIRKTTYDRISPAARYILDV
jgi:ectoine hydroxylase-related dioxygenase (phytanoyl-CoA dioxygenase family)